MPENPPNTSMAAGAAVWAGDDDDYPTAAPASTTSKPQAAPAAKAPGNKR